MFNNNKQDDMLNRLVNEVEKQDLRRLQHISETLLEQQFLEREERSAVVEERLRAIKETKVTQKQQTLAVTEATKIKQLYAVDKFLRLVDRVSYENRTAGQVLFHSLLGQMFNKEKLYMGNNYTDPRVPILWWQSSGSGKGKMMELFTDVVQSVQKINRVTFDAFGKEIVHGRPFVMNKIDRTNTASALNDWVWDEKKRKYMVDETGEPMYELGWASGSDFISMNEAIPLFRTNSQTEDLPEFFITVMNPIGTADHIYWRDKKGYPRRCDTEADATIILTTRELFGVDMLTAGSGLIQRCAALFEKLDTDRKQRMMEKVSVSLWNTNPTGGKRHKQEITELAEDLTRISLFIRKIKGQIGVKDEQELGAFTLQKLNDFIERSVIDVPNKELRDVLEAFIRRYPEMARKLSYHSAAMRMSKFIEIQDAEYAFEIIDKLYVSQARFIEDTVKLDRDVLYKEKAQMSSIQLCFKRKKIDTMYVSELVSHLCMDMQISKSKSYEVVERFASGEEPMLIKNKKKTGRQTISLRNYKDVRSSNDK